MNSTVKMLIGYIIAGVIIFLIVEEIKKYRAKKTNYVSKPITNLPTNNIETGKDLMKSQSPVIQNIPTSRTIVY